MRFLKITPSISPAFKKEDLENYRPVSLISVPRKITEKILLETISKPMKKVIVSGRCRFMTGKSCLADPTVHSTGGLAKQRDSFFTS